MIYKELRELDAWIAEHVMGLSLCMLKIAILGPNEFVLSIPNKIARARIGDNPTCNFMPTVNAATALEVLKKCVEKIGWSNGIVIDKVPEQSIWFVGCEEDKENGCDSETLELAICLFAKKLFTK